MRDILKTFPDINEVKLDKLRQQWQKKNSLQYCPLHESTIYHGEPCWECWEDCIIKEEDLEL